MSRWLFGSVVPRLSRLLRRVQDFVRDHWDRPWLGRGLVFAIDCSLVVWSGLLRRQDRGCGVLSVDALRCGVLAVYW